MATTVSGAAILKGQDKHAILAPEQPAEQEERHAQALPLAKASIEATACLAHLQERQRQLDLTQEASRQRAARLARRAAQAIFPSFPQVRRAYLFGSITRPGAMHRDSDIDIAVEGRLDAKGYFALWRELERAITDWAVEVVELERDVRFAERVRQTGELIYEHPDSCPVS